MSLDYDFQSVNRTLIWPVAPFVFDVEEVAPETVRYGVENPEHLSKHKNQHRVLECHQYVPQPLY